MSGSSSSYSFSARDREQSLRTELRKRGIYNPGTLLRLTGVEEIEGAIRWYDEQRARSARVSPGVLANAIRDGGMPGYGSAPPEPECTHTPELGAEWQLLSDPLEHAFGEDCFAIWLANLHPHRHHPDRGWLLGAPSSTAAYVADRYGRIIAEVLSERVRVVACDRSPA